MLHCKISHQVMLLTPSLINNSVFILTNQFLTRYFSCGSKLNKLCVTQGLGFGGMLIARCNSYSCNGSNYVFVWRKSNWMNIKIIQCWKSIISLGKQIHKQKHHGITEMTLGIFETMSGYCTSVMYVISSTFWKWQ